MTRSHPCRAARHRRHGCRRFHSTGGDSTMRTESRWVSASVLIARTALSLALLPAFARADWPLFGRAICTQTSTQVHPTITTDGAGGAIVTWQDFRLPRVNVFAQHVFASGE